MLNKKEKQNLLNYFEELCKAYQYYHRNLNKEDVAIMDERLITFYDIAKAIGFKPYEYAEIGCKYLRD